MKKNYEVLQLIGSFKISQNKKEEAVKFLLQSKENWNLYEESPPYDVKINFVKLFLELELYETSVEIIEEILEENDSDSELWFLNSFSLLSIDPVEAKISLDKCCEIISNNGIDAPSILSQIEDLNEKKNYKSSSK